MIYLITVKRGNINSWEAVRGKDWKILENRWLFLIDRKGYPRLLDWGYRTPAFFSVKIV